MPKTQKRKEETMKLSTMFAAVMILAATAFAGEAKITVTNLTGGAKVGELKIGALRVVGYPLSVVPDELKGATCVTVPRGDSGKPGAGYSFTIDKAATVYLLYMVRGKVEMPEGWEKTKLVTKWKAGASEFTDEVFKKDFPAGKVEIPVNNSKDGSYGIPHTVVLIPEK